MGIELTPAFWSGLLQIIIVNIILSGDNAVVIALAARSLPERQQKQAILYGAGAAVDAAQVRGQPVAQDARRRGQHPPGRTGPARR